MLIRSPIVEKVSKPVLEEQVSKKPAREKQLFSVEPTQKKKAVSKPRAVVDDSVEVGARIKELFKKYEGKYWLVTTEQGLIDYLSTRPELGFDTETTGLNRYLDTIAGFSVGNADDCIYVPLNHKKGKNYEGSLDRLKEILTSGGRKYWGMNTKFDRGFVRVHLGFDIPMCWDAELAARLLDNRDNAKLKSQYIKYIDPSEEFYEYKSLFKRPFTEYDPELVGVYGGVDAMKHYVLGKFQKQKMEDHFPRIYKLMKNVELPLIDVVLGMELRGIAIDKDYYAGFCADLKGQVDKKLNEIQSQFPGFNPNSAKQVAEVLFDRLHLADPSKARKTGEEWLVKINHPIAQAILDIRKLTKAISTYAEAIPACAIDDSDGIPIVHTTYHTIGADCVVGDTVISTNGGLRKISDIVPKDCTSQIPFTVDLINRFGEVEKTSHCVKFTNVPTCKVNLSFGFEIEGTPHHPVRTKSGWKELKNLDIGDWVEMPINYDYAGEEVKFENLVPTHRTSAKPFICPKVMDEELAEFVGMFHADGSIRSGNGSCELRFANKNIRVKERIAYLGEKLFGVTPKVAEDGVTFVSKNFLLYSELFPSGAFNKEIPDAILRSHKNVFAKFLLGRTLDSSFCTSKGSIAITVPTKSVAQYIRQFLLSIGVLTNLKFEATGSIRRVKTGAEHTGFYRIVVPRYFVPRFLEVVGTHKDVKEVSVKFNAHHKYRIEENSIFVRVESVVKCVNDVYDFTLPKTHSFIGNGIACHNTGRFSSSDPNLQNQPRDDRFRRGFVARPGHKLISADFSQQEQAILAGGSQDPKMIDGANAGRDYYALMASIIWDLPYESCTKKGEHKKLRDKCKSIVLGVTYGMSSKSLAESLNSDKSDGHVYTVEECDKILKKFYSGFPLVKKFQEDCANFGSYYGYMETVLGRRRYFNYLGKPAFEVPSRPDIERKLNGLKYYNQIRSVLDNCKAEGIEVFDNRWKQQDELRQTTNFYCQGSAADQTKVCMLAIARDEDFVNKYHGRLLLQIHDEVIAEFPEEFAVEGGKHMAMIMSEVGSEVGRSKIWCEPSDPMDFWKK